MKQFLATLPSGEQVLVTDYEDGQTPTVATRRTAFATWLPEVQTEDVSA